MDPLSIAAGVVPLLEATGFVTKSIFKLVRAHRNADSSIAGLCQELSSLTTVLQAVDKASRQFGHGSLDSGLVEADLRHEIEQALLNCELSLGALSRLIQKIESYRHRGFAWKSRAAVALSIYENDLVAFRDRIHQCNWALQTILNTINVSLSLRNNRSQTQILFELGKLKLSIDQALQVSLQPVGGFSQASNSLADRLTGNLRQLAEAAKNFHSAATSTTSTVRADQSNVSSHRWSERQSSVAGHFPTITRERVEEFLLQGSASERQDASNLPTLQNSHSTVRPAAPAPKNPTLNHLNQDRVEDLRSGDIDIKPQDERFENRGEPEDEDDDDIDLEMMYRSGLRDLAMESVRSFDLERAIVLLKEVLDVEEVTEASLGLVSRGFKVQLAICYFMKGSWELAEPIVKALARSHHDRDLVACELLHALAIAQLAHGKPKSALKTCQRALQGKKKLCKAQDSLDSTRAEIFRRQIPEDFDYEHCDSPGVFIVKHEHLVRALLMLEADQAVSTEALDRLRCTTTGPVTANRDGQDRELEETVSNAGDIEPENSHCDVDDETSPVSPFSPLPPQTVRAGFSRIFGRMMTRKNHPRGSLSSGNVHGRMLSWIRGQPTEAKAVTATTNMTGEWVTADNHRLFHQGQDGSDLWTPDPFPSRHEMVDTGVFELCDTSRPTELSDIGLTPFKTVNEHSQFGSLKADPDSGRHVVSDVVSEAISETHNPGPQSQKDSDLQVTLGRVACLLASLPTTKDSDSLHAFKLELELLLGDLADGNDPMLRGDIAATIDSLNSLEDPKQQTPGSADSSGYESSQPRGLDGGHQFNSDSRHARSYISQEDMNNTVSTLAKRGDPDNAQDDARPIDGLDRRETSMVSDIWLNSSSSPRKEDRPVPKIKNVDILVKTHQRRDEARAMGSPKE